MTQQGYIKLHRQILEWEWYKNIPVRIVFEHCLLKANHTDKNWQGILIKKGSFITSYENLSIETGLSFQQVRTAINKLKSTNELTYQSTSRYSIISINNWSLFQQDNKQDNKQITNNQQTNNKQITTTNNEKNEKNEKKLFIRPSLQEVEQYCTDRNNNINAQYFMSYYDAKGWMIGKNKVKDWKACIRTWELRNKKENKDKNKLLEMLKESEN